MRDLRRADAAGDAQAAQALRRLPGGGRPGLQCAKDPARDTESCIFFMDHDLVAGLLLFDDLYARVAVLEVAAGLRTSWQGSLPAQPEE